MDYAGLLKILGCTDAQVHSIYRCGSRVYGTATPTSDEDFVAVLTSKDQRQDLAFAPGVNVVVHGVETFRAALAAQSVFALECIFAPPEHQLKTGRPPWPYRPNARQLADAAIERSDADFAKALKRFAEEPLASKKRMFHALRVPMFALQVLRLGRIVDFGEANVWWDELRERAEPDGETYRAQYGPVRDACCTNLRELAKRGR